VCVCARAERLRHVELDCVILLMLSSLIHLYSALTTQSFTAALQW